MLRLVCSPASVLAIIIFAQANLAWAQKLTLKKDVGGNPRGIAVYVDDKLFTEYLIHTGPKPILWPVIGPGGMEMTRQFPMKLVDGEKADHPHQRSLWFTHGNVNGVDFWAEKSSRSPDHGSVVHREFKKAEVEGDRVVIATLNDWIGPDGKKHLEDERTLTFRATSDSRSIDFDILLKATEGPVTFGDTKEGSMAIRVPTVMDVDSKQGGRIVTSEGLTDKEAWGKPARWVDYHGPVGGEVVGVAIMNHPSSFRYPTTWHVRTYGLFAANPFGLHDFTASAGVDGAHTIPAGGTMTLRYRFLFHRGDEKQAGVADAFATYAKEK